MNNLLNSLKIKRPPDNACSQEYRGRFAPSPSGFLHFGSLIAALASFLQAKSQQGLWLVRLEDIDPPREQLGASKAILKTLDAFGLHWDETELYQSQQTALYNDVLTSLAEQKQSYNCQCTRAEIKAIGGVYQGHCRSLNRPLENSATRVINTVGISHYQDLIQGEVSCNKALAQEDFIVFRKDGLFAYQLAVVVDDIFQGINHVIRGCDLLEPTARQLSFFKLLQCPAPKYGHVPLAITPDGYKLSKQNKAPAINNNKPQPALFAALHFLGQQPPNELETYPVNDIIQWAIAHWSLEKVPKQREIVF
jgi:glutamyl-Q tRNA(Asp) synthetase